jgi:hypothetical protein
MAGMSASVARVRPHCGCDPGAKTPAEHREETKCGESPSHKPPYRRGLSFG